MAEAKRSPESQRLWLNNVDNRGKESHIYGTLKDGVFSGFCSLCGARIPKYRDDYQGKKICVNCHAELVPWDGKGGRNVYLTVEV